MGRLRPEICANLRGFSVSSYIILYHMTDDAIEIVNIVHGSRDIEGLFLGSSTKRRRLLASSHRYNMKNKKRDGESSSLNDHTPFFNRPKRDFR